MSFFFSKDEGLQSNTCNISYLTMTRKEYQKLISVEGMFRVNQVLLTHRLHGSVKYRVIHGWSVVRQYIWYSGEIFMHIWPVVSVLILHISLKNLVILNIASFILTFRNLISLEIYIYQPSLVSSAFTEIVKYLCFLRSIQTQHRLHRVHIHRIF